MNSNESPLSNARNDEVRDAIRRFSTPEFLDEITRLFGEAKDKAIAERNARLLEQANENE